MGFGADSLVKGRKLTDDAWRRRLACFACFFPVDIKPGFYDTLPGYGGFRNWISFPWTGVAVRGNGASVL